MKNLIAFFEIPSVDFERAVCFYETVLETRLSVFDWGKEKMAFFTERELCVGAISFASDFLPSSNGVLIHFNCESIDEKLSAVVNAGGDVVIAKTKIEAEDRGYFAVFSDSEGNHIGLYSDK